VYRTSQVILLAIAIVTATGCQQQDEGTQPQSSGNVATGVAVNSTSETSGGGTSQHKTPAVRQIDVSEALAQLMEGNQRFVKGESIHPHESTDYRASLANEQHPFATVLTCSDSRVTPVLIFDQGVGDLFVIRVAGNVIDEDVAGSIEYAVDHLGAKLLIVLGHENCGAVTAAYHAFVAKDLREREPHEIEHLLMQIEPAVRSLDRSKPMEEQIANAVEENVRVAIESLQRVPDVQKAQDAGMVKIIGAVYSVRTGAVRLLDM
jgi:carbonic anhydrase